MKPVKHLIAVILCLCLLVGMPMSVSAVGTVDDTWRPRVLSVMAVTCGAKSDPDLYFALYFTRDISGLPSDWGKYNLWVDVYQGDTLVESKVAVTNAGNNNYHSTEVEDAQFQRCPAFGFADTTKGFSYYKNQYGETTRFVFNMQETTAISTYNDDCFREMTAKSGGNPVQSNAKIDGCDALIMPIITQDQWLTVKGVYRTSKVTFTVEFSEPVAMAAMQVDGGPVEAYLRVVDSSNTLQTYTNGNYTQHQAVSANIHADNACFVDFTFTTEGVQSLENKLLEDSFADCSMKLYLADCFANLDCANRGESPLNRMLDGIWSQATQAPLVVDVRNKSDHSYLTYSTPVAFDGDAFYDSVQAALAAADNGDTVTVCQDATITDTVMLVPAGVTLDLNGHAVTAANLISFGNILDSTEGTGGIVISNDDSKAGIHMQKDNTAMPLYDNDRYRFFTYDVISAGTKDHTTDAAVAENAVKFGTKIVFNSQSAYELLAGDAELVMQLQLGDSTFMCQFDSATMQALSDAVAADFEKRADLAVTLTVYGLDALTEETNVSATPMLYSSTDAVGSDAAMAYTYNPNAGVE